MLSVTRTPFYYGLLFDPSMEGLFILDGVVLHRVINFQIPDKVNLLLSTCSIVGRAERDSTIENIQT